MSRSRPLVIHVTIRSLRLDRGSASPLDPVCTEVAGTIADALAAQPGASGSSADIVAAVADAVRGDLGARLAALSSGTGGRHGR